LELKYEMRFTQVSNYHTFHCITNALTKAFHPSIKKEQVALINQYRSCGLCKQWTKTYYISHQTVVALSSSWISDWHKYHTFSRRNTRNNKWEEAFLFISYGVLRQRKHYNGCHLRLFFSRI